MKRSYILSKKSKVFTILVLFSLFVSSISMGYAEDGQPSTFIIYIRESDELSFFDQFSWNDSLTGDNTYKPYEFEIRGDWMCLIPHGQEDPVRMYNLQTGENRSIQKPPNQDIARDTIIYENGTVIFLSEVLGGGELPGVSFYFENESATPIKTKRIESTLEPQSSSISIGKQKTHSPYIQLVRFQLPNYYTEYVFFELDTCTVRRYTVQETLEMQGDWEYFSEYNHTLFSFNNGVTNSTIYSLKDESWQSLAILPQQVFNAFILNDTYFLIGQQMEGFERTLTVYPYNLITNQVQDPTTISVNISSGCQYSYEKLEEIGEFQLYETYLDDLPEVIIRDNITRIDNTYQIIELTPSGISTHTFSPHPNCTYVPIESDPLTSTSQVVLYATIPENNGTSLTSHGGESSIVAYPGVLLSLGVSVMLLIKHIEQKRTLL